MNNNIKPPCTNSEQSVSFETFYTYWVKIKRHCIYNSYSDVTASETHKCYLDNILIVLTAYNGDKFMSIKVQQKETNALLFEISYSNVYDIVIKETDNYEMRNFLKLLRQFN